MAHIILTSSSSSVLILLAVMMMMMMMMMSGVSSMPEPLTHYRAAVYEHAPFFPEPEMDTRDEAVELMYKNLDVYATKATEARKEGANIIVFPEDGIYGWVFPTRESIRPFLEKIPDPKLTDWSPCKDPTRYPNTEVLHALSCMANENGLYVVANMGDLVPCNKNNDPECPSDGGYQYNTDVAFDPEGNLVARYHKVNLYFEGQFNKPEPEVVYFDTPFGRFGLLVCFDLIFKSPAVSMLADHSIANIAYPTAWMDAMPMLSAIGYHSSFARGSGVNFLAANNHVPTRRMQGSGIYTPKGVADYYYNSEPNSPGKLMVATLDVLQNNGGIEERVVSEKNIQNPSNSTGQEFISSLLHDNYKFQLLEGTSGTMSLCHGQLCCSLDYKLSSDDQGSKREFYALGAFDCLHTHHGVYYLQTCALVKCGNNNDKMSCGHYTFDAHTKFDYLSLTGTFQTKYVYPQVLMVKDKQLLLGKKSSWSFQDNVLTSQEGLDQPLLSATLVGRYYSRD